MKSTIILYAGVLITYIVNIVAVCLCGADLASCILAWACAMLWCITCLVLEIVFHKRRKELDVLLNKIMESQAAEIRSLIKNTYSKEGEQDAMDKK